MVQKKQGASIVEEIFELDKDRSEVKGKIVPLREAIARSVKPGMKLHINTGAYANAALREIIRQYRGKDPGFTVISAGIATPYEIGLALSGLAKKVLTTNYSYTYPTPRPIPLFQKMGKEGRIEIENWSLYTLEQRLMAGALGVGFMPSRSLMGTTVAEENAHAFKIMPDPFDEKKDIGVVKALNPDISLVHGCAADCEGNTILSPPYFASLWGPKASSGGVIVTVEKIVPAEFIRRHSALVKIPGHIVKFVCPVPFGSHPQGLASESIGVDGGYGEDYEFVRDFVGASKDSAGLEEWMKKWIFECETQDHYLQRLGPERILFLKGKSSADGGKCLPSGFDPDSVNHLGFNATEMMVVAAAREIRGIIAQRGYETILAGIGAAGLAAWLAFYMSRKGNDEFTLLTGLGHVGYVPRPGDPFLMTLSNVMTCTMLTDCVEVYGAFVGGANNKCLSILGTAQIDQYGNLNTVQIDGAPFIGLGGAGDAVNALETLVLAKQSRARFMEKVPFVGCPGQRIKTLVTDLGLLKKLGDDDTFTLTKYFSNPADRGEEEHLREIKERCGWTLKVAQELEKVLPPTSEELAILRNLDPQRLFLGK